MAAVNLTVNQPRVSGITPTVQTGVVIAATDQYFMANDGKTILRVSGGTADAAMTVVSVLDVDGLAVADRTIAIPAGATRLVGPFRPDVYNNDDRNVQITFAAADTTLVLEAFRL